MSNSQTLLDCVGMVCFGNQISVPGLKIVAPLCAVDCYPDARRITDGLASMDASPEEHLRDAKRALGDTAWAEWNITATEFVNEERAQEIFFEEELRESLQAKLCNATEGLQPGTYLDAVLKKQKNLLEAEASWVIVANWETDYEPDEVVAITATDAKNATSGVATLFSATLKLHVAARVDLVEMLSHNMVESACTLLRKITVGVTVMHVRQSGTLQEVLTKMKRRKFRSAPSCNARGESILASIDHSLSLRPNQTTASASVVAVMQQNQELVQIVVEKMMNPKTVAACELDIEAAR
jgi:hypothetical protein